VTNFPDELQIVDLWKLFSHFGSVGDVYIPNKLDKWGKRFAFVKFKGVKEVDELSGRLEEVWSGSFKLRVNRARFDRNELSSQSAKQQEDNRQVRNLETIGANGLSFKDALRTPTMVKPDEVMQVEADQLVLEDLQQSFVGSLALEVDIEKIRTMLFMEGRQHISVTPMGGKLILLHSPRKGELGTMVKAKEDWLTYYFKTVKPWSANDFNDRREVWVKVLGVPLHVWGEKFFKLVGNRFGEFVDFDADTASRSRFDVARIKLSTPCRSLIDCSIQVSALGCVYKVWVVEERSSDIAWVGERREGDDEYSMVDSAMFPKKAPVVNVGSDCSSGGDDGVVGDRACCTNSQLSAGVVLCAKSNSSLHLIGEKGQTGSREADLLCATFKETSTVFREKGGQMEEGVIRTSEASQQDVVSGAMKVVGSVGKGDTRVEETQATLNAVLAGGVGAIPHGVEEFGDDKVISVSVQELPDPVVDVMGQDMRIGPERGPNLFCPDRELLGPVHSISIGGPGGVFIDKGQTKKHVVVSSISESQELSLEGEVTSPFPYVYKEKGKKKSKHHQQQSQMGVPKCIQLVEVVQQGRMGVKKNKRNKSSESGQICGAGLGGDSGVSGAGGAIDRGDEDNIEAAAIPQVTEPVILGSGVLLLQGDENSINSDEQGSAKSGQRLLQKEASKLLQIQKSVGFSFELEDQEVCDRMVENELRDRAQKVVREQTIVDQ
jgi:hypothetical protein